MLRHKRDINKVFKLFDDDKTGYITLKNIRRVAKELDETMTEKELKEMIERADSNADGKVTSEYFNNIILGVNTFTAAGILATVLALASRDY